ncbi:YczE/YyaS/YitT family protein [Metabacillus malikii]|uniref:Membrane protein YczE n=1 Tax=Metabacillus malikii TaxID=1504265 RepID=A0ABT9ZJ08_9BACI|nr:YitT family protein [Metabacillus malikii]MDQ0231528.1 putative membrane protein YczE [Metabacillus malikii]
MKQNRLMSSIIKWFIFFIGLFIMAFGIVLTMKANLGVSSWDVLHMGLYYRFGLSIGTWSILIGVIVLISSSLLSKKLPQLGAIINMLSVGVFIDLYMLMPVLQTPDTFLGKMCMLLLGILVLGFGMGLYISAKRGTGPRDSLMIALVEKTGRSITFIRGTIEVIVLVLGWILGGPVFIGTIIATASMGYVAGIMIPLCEKWTEWLVYKVAIDKRQMHNPSFMNRNI